MRIVIDIECNSLINPNKIWLIVCKDADKDADWRYFRNLTEDENEKNRFLQFSKSVDYWIGHNFLGYDYPVLHNLLGLTVDSVWDVCCDTLIVSKLVNYSRPNGHSIEAYGREFGLEKIKFNDWTKLSKEMEDYCVRDTEICHQVYNLYRDVINSPDWRNSIVLEHRFQLVANNLHDNGFNFDVDGATRLHGWVRQELERLDQKILAAFPPKEVLIREFVPKRTKFGTISRTSVPRQLHAHIHEFEVGKVYRHTRLEPFNPSSHKQLIEVLNASGWKPEDKTQTHIDTLRNIKNNTELKLKLDKLKIYGYKINENNLSTLPPRAPEPARLLAKRILLESRRRTLAEWLGLVKDDGRIHGKFQAIGAWTHRMAHQQPNTANIPNEFDLNGKKKLLGKELRALWCAPQKRLLVGVDAEGIQLRIFAHYIDDKEFTNALVRGEKAKKTDPHSLNQRILGHHCKTRAAAKRFIYALLLGAGMDKLAAILECPVPAAKEALDRLLQRYQGFRYLKKEVIPKDAKVGYFIGLDGRKVPIPGETQRDREHLCMSGYLQNAESIIMKLATLRWENDLHQMDSLLVNLVHDEWQTEVPDMGVALQVAAIQAESLRMVGERLALRCPLAGSYWNDDHKTYTIGQDWSVTH